MEDIKELKAIIMQLQSQVNQLERRLIHLEKQNIGEKYTTDISVEYLIKSIKTKNRA